MIWQNLTNAHLPLTLLSNRIFTQSTEILRSRARDVIFLKQAFNYVLANAPLRLQTRQIFSSSMKKIIKAATELRIKNWIFWIGQRGTPPGLTSKRGWSGFTTYYVYALTNIWVRLGYSLRWIKKTKRNFSEVAIDAYIFHTKSDLGIWAYNQGQESQQKRVKCNIRELKILKRRHFLGVLASYAAELYLS